jgi:hypothetical protein
VKRRGDMTGRHGYGMLGRHVSVAIGRVQNRLPGCRAQRIRAPGKSAIDVKKPSSDETRRTLTWTAQPGCGHVLRHVLGCEQASPPRRVEKPEGEVGRSVTVGVPQSPALSGTAPRHFPICLSDGPCFSANRCRCCGALPLPMTPADSTAVDR